MKTMTRIVGIIVLLITISPADADECNTRDMPDELYKLINEKNYKQAVTKAKTAYENDSNNKEAAFVLARVYVNSTLLSIVNLDTEKLGFAPGESGTKKITADMLERAASSTFTVNQDYLQEADKFIRLAVKRWPEARDFYYCLTKIHFYSRDHDKFIQSLAETAELQKDHDKQAVDFLINYATELMNEERHQQAESVYRTLLKTYPNSVPVLSSLGVARLNQGFTADGASYFDKAYLLDNKDEIVVGNIAEVSMLLADFKKAEKFLLEKARLMPDKADIYFDLAMNAMHDNPAKSGKYWKMYFKIHEKHPDNEGWASNAKAIQEAVKDKERGIGDWYNLAEQMKQIRLPKYAIPLLHYVQKQSPKDATVFYSMAHAYDIGGHYDLQDIALQRTLSLIDSPENRYKLDKNQVHHNLARTSHALGKNKKALMHLSNVSSASGDGAGVHHLYGLIYNAMGDQKKAKQHFELCLKKNPDDSMKRYCERML
ncbi:MAG: hypothetical protein OEZ23_03640 [Gammaproteobacteria bacterium]|nr:hypothetical protein [Gammaproteobacteria bacterium]